MQRLGTGCTKEETTSCFGSEGLGADTSSATIQLSAGRQEEAGYCHATDASSANSLRHWCCGPVRLTCSATRAAAAPHLL